MCCCFHSDKVTWEQRSICVSADNLPLNQHHLLHSDRRVNEGDYLEVSHHDEAGSTDPGGGEPGRVEDAVLVLLDDVSVTQQTNQHHWRTARERTTRFITQMKPLNQQHKHKLWVTPLMFGSSCSKEKKHFTNVHRSLAVGTMTSFLLSLLF